MSLKYAILGLLIEHPMHGYELKRGLSPALSRDGLVNDGVLYPLLAKMEKEKLLAAHVESVPGRRDRTVFRPTPRGKRTFLKWLANNEGEEDEVTYDFFLGHPFLAKCMFFDQLDRDEVLGKLAAQKISARAKLDAFTRIRRGMVLRGVLDYRVSILELGMAQQKQKIRWLDRLAKATSKKRASKERRKKR